MSFSDLFKSKKEIEKEKRKAQRAEERKVERAIDNNNDRIGELKKEQKTAWEQARLQLQQGNRPAAERLLMQYKAIGVNIAKFEKQMTWAKNQLNTIRGAVDTKTTAEALKNLAGQVELSPEDVAEDIAAVDDIGADIKDIGKEMDKAFEKDQKNVLAEAQADVTSLDDDPLMAALEQEAAVEITGERKAVEGMGQPSARLDDINAGRDRLNALLKN